MSLIRDGQPIASPTVGVVEQTPVVLQGSFKDNIVFGQPFDEAKYRRVVHEACLEHDLEHLSHGDDTEIGERGVNLSGGQKSRVAFARMLYQAQTCDFFIMDDPFAAVDVDVANKMFLDGVQGSLANKTRVLVLSSHIELLEHADHILMLGDGGVIASGPYNDLFGPSSRTTSLLAAASSSSSAQPDTTTKAVPAGDGKLIVAEDREEGAVNSQLIRLYASFARQTKKASPQVVSGSESSAAPTRSQPPPASGGNIIVFMVLVSFLIGEAIRVSADIWLTWWADEDADNVPSGLEDKSDTFWTWTLAVFVSVFIIYVLGRSQLFVYLAMKSGKHMHTTVLHNLLRAPLLFFHQNPAGRVLNRFSSDMHRIDLTLPDIMFQFLEAAFILISGVIFAFISVPYLLVLFIPLALAFYVIQKYFRATSRQLLRLDGITRSPIFGEFSQNLRARCTIRAFNALQRTRKRIEGLINCHLKLFLLVCIVPASVLTVRVGWDQ